MEQLRATLHSDLQEKNDILDKLTNERGKSSVILLRTKGSWLRSCYFFLSVSFTLFPESAEKLQTELRELRVQHYTLKEQHDDLREKMKFFTKVFMGVPYNLPL